MLALPDADHSLNDPLADSLRRIVGQHQEGEVRGRCPPQSAEEIPPLFSEGHSVLNGLRFAEDMTGSEPQNRCLGYARVSTYGQTLDAQLDQLRGAGCARIYREKATGARADRRELLRMLDRLAPGDVVTVTRIDRLARSTFDLFAIVKRIVDAGAQFRSLAEPWADTGTSTGRLMIAVLGGLADVERDLIRTRTAEGREHAQRRGQHMGRPSKLTAAQKTEARRRRAEGATLAELARSYNVSKGTISRLME
jgi:DNA invertase Pin-like site-specific DNA recombinase